MWIWTQINCPDIYIFFFFYQKTAVVAAVPSSPPPNLPPPRRLGNQLDAGGRATDSVAAATDSVVFHPSKNNLPSLFPLVGLGNSNWQPGGEAANFPDACVKRLLVREDNRLHMIEFSAIVSHQNLVEKQEEKEQTRRLKNRIDEIAHDFDRQRASAEPSARFTLKTVNIDDPYDYRALFLRTIGPTTVVQINKSVSDTTRWEYSRLLFTAAEVNLEDFCQTHFVLRLSDLMWGGGPASLPRPPVPVVHETSLGTVVSAWLQWLQDERGYGLSFLTVAMSSAQKLQRFVLNEGESPENYLAEVGPQREQYALWRRNLLRDIQLLSTRILKINAEADNAQIARRLSYMADVKSLRQDEIDFNNQIAKAVHGKWTDRVLDLARDMGSGKHPELCTEQNYNLVMYTGIVLLNLPCGQRPETVVHMEDNDLFRSRLLDESDSNWFIAHVGRCLSMQMLSLCLFLFIPYLLHFMGGCAFTYNCLTVNDVYQLLLHIVLILRTGYINTNK